MQSQPTAVAAAGCTDGSPPLRRSPSPGGQIRGRAALRALALVLGLLLGLTGLPGIASADELGDVQALVTKGDLARASDRLDAILAKHPKDARARFLRGVVLTEQKRPADAMKVFTALTEDYPELPEPYNNLAVLHAAQGQLDRARQLLESAIRNHPGFATAHQNLGDIHARMAAEAYERALQFDRSNTAVQARLKLIRELFPANPKLLRLEQHPVAHSTAQPLHVPRSEPR